MEKLSKFALWLGCLGLCLLSPKWAVAKAQAAEGSGGFFQFSARSVDGSMIPFSTYSGKVILVVNVASQCGYTPQYAELEKLFEKYKDMGFVILGFPSNDFGEQEPGSDAEIKKFCKVNYGVKFPLFSKSQVMGKEKNPIYRFLVDNSPSEPHQEVAWNFEKFLIDRKGKIVQRYKSQVTPDNRELVQVIEKEISVH